MELGIKGLCSLLAHWDITLPLSTSVPTPKGLRHKRLEGNPLPPALLCSTIHFAAIGEVKGMPTGRSRTWQGGNLERGDDGDIHGSVLAADPVRDQDISWSTVIPREEEAALFHWTKACS